MRYVCMLYVLCCCCSVCTVLYAVLSSVYVMVITSRVHRHIVYYHRLFMLSLSVVLVFISCCHTSQRHCLTLYQALEIEYTEQSCRHTCSVPVSGPFSGWAGEGGERG